MDRRAEDGDCAQGGRQTTEASGRQGGQQGHVGGVSGTQTGEADGARGVQRDH